MKCVCFHSTDAVAMIKVDCFYRFHKYVPHVSVINVLHDIALLWTLIIKWIATILICIIIITIVCL